MKSKRVLFIGGQSIFEKVQQGGSQCSKRNYDLLCRICDENNTNIYAVVPTNKKYLNMQNVFRYTAVKNEFQRLVAAIFMCKQYFPWEERKVLSYIKSVKPDLLFLDSSVLGKILSHKRLLKNTKKVVFFHNIEYDYTFNKVRNQSKKYMLSFLASAYNEKRAIKYADKIICLNKRDSDRLFQLYYRRSDMLLPISFKDEFDIAQVKRNSNDKQLLFIGSYFPPNYHGIKWFIDNVMINMPDYKLTIIGKDFESKRKELERDNVSVIGTVDTLSEYYYKASSIVMPILYGDGMKVKTAEAMMYGMTIFATNEALEGYDIEGINGIYRCNEAKEFENAIRAYYETAANTGYQDEVRKCFLDNYEEENQFGKLKDFLIC